MGLPFRLGFTRSSGRNSAHANSDCGGGVSSSYPPLYELQVPLILDEMWRDTIPSASWFSSSYTSLKLPGDACEVMGNSGPADSIRWKLFGAMVMFVFESACSEEDVLRNYGNAQLSSCIAGDIGVAVLAPTPLT